MATVATTAAPMMETAAAGTRAPTAAHAHQPGGPYASLAQPGTDDHHHQAFGAVARAASRTGHDLTGFVTAAAGSTAGQPQHNDILTATYALQSLGGIRAASLREMMGAAAAPSPQNEENAADLTTSDDDSVCVCVCVCVCVVRCISKSCSAWVSLSLFPLANIPQDSGGHHTKRRRSDVTI
jgi:hypothetical protein